MKKPVDIDAYISGFPKETQKVLQHLRSIIKKNAPQVSEVISYGMPGFKLDGMLVWFAGYAKHVGFYPKPSGIEAFRKELSIYKSAKGSVQFPLDKPLPVAVITKIVKFRVKENRQQIKMKEK